MSSKIGCHPDRKPRRRGMCAPCYLVAWRRKRKEWAIDRAKKRRLCKHCGKKLKAVKNNWYACQDCVNRLSRERNNAARDMVLKYFKNKCNCCGESRPEFLCVDHVQNDGAAHRKKLKGYSIYHWLINNKFPSGFQLLCHNCNMAKGLYGYCPHAREK